ncbi:hypothetical protein LOAG_00145 [Loa loa]|uniref:Uncharacterized protein n=1 Tax=Loa loa TaxID=7209 RepID=A0A1S0UBR7_LOALO|nr:hypothetical protein LOAG_00145 [Loa loa]EFO28326.1 hypothetical protein LOAG_00145 [Loa loa]
MRVFVRVCVCVMFVQPGRCGHINYRSPETRKRIRSRRRQQEIVIMCLKGATSLPKQEMCRLESKSVMGETQPLEGGTEKILYPWCREEAVLCEDERLEHEACNGKKIPREYMKRYSDLHIHRYKCIAIMERCYAKFNRAINEGS